MPLTYAKLMDKISQIARDDNFDVYQPKEGFDEIFHCCYLIMGHFGDKRRAVLQILCLNEANDTPSEREPEDIQILQLMSVLPTTVPSNLAHGGRKLIDRINKALPLGAFGLSEVDSAIYFKYSHVVTDETTSPEYFGQILSTIHAYFDMFVPVLFAYASAGMTYDQALEKMSELFELDDVSVLPFPFFPENG